jgi:hypothetical protein
MKLSRLESTTQHTSPEAAERARHVSASTIRRVEASEGVEGDRQRSLQQELAEYDPRAIGPFEGSELVLDSARQVAAQLTLLGSNMNGLVKLQALSQRFTRIDDKV